MNLQQARYNMIEQQVRPWDVLDPGVLSVLGDVSRDEFVAPEHRSLAFSDFELPIGHGQFMLKPNVEGRLLQALELTATDTVLEIGTGSGHLTACLARLAEHCDSVEIVPDLLAAARARLEHLGIANVTLSVQDAATVWDARDAYHAIAFGGAVEQVPQYFLDKLAVGGRLFAIVGDVRNPTLEACLIRRVDADEWSTESLFETRVAPLTGFDLPRQAFSF